jgi:serine/threonine-protein kinase
VTDKSRRDGSGSSDEALAETRSSGDAALAETRSSDEALAETVDSSSPSAGAHGGQPVIGSLLGNRYEVLTLLGQGAFGSVYRALDRVAERVVAIKVMSEAAVKSPQMLRRVRRELQSAVQVTHPTVVRIHDLFEIDGRLMLSMELVEGETLAERLRRQPQLPVTELVALMDDLTQALAAAHAAGVIHRDLKPANIMIRKSNGRAVVTDFGLSRLAHGQEELSGSGSIQPPGQSPKTPNQNPLTIEGEVMGTPVYMAPEQMIGRDVAAPADLYALGVILFEAATGKRPHEAGTIPELYALRMYHPIPPIATLRSDLPAWMCELIDHCLKADQKLRHPNAVVLREEVVKRMTGPTQSQAPRFVLRRRHLAIPLVLVLAAAGIYGWLRLRPLPAGERRVALAVHNEGAAADDWIVPALTRMAEARIREHARSFSVGPQSRANVLLDVGFRRSASKGVHVSAAFRRPGGRAMALDDLDEPSVAAAVDKMVGALDQRLGEGRGERGPTAEETADMKIVGAKSFAVYRLFQRALREAFGSLDADMDAAKRLLDEALREQPDWAHAHAFLVLAQGRSSPQARELLRRAQEQTASSEDASGRAIIEALSASFAGDLKRSTSLLDQGFRKTPQDLLLGYALCLELFADQHIDEALAVTKTLHEEYPAYQFGADAATFLRMAGRGDDIAELNRRWLERAPESEEALVSQAKFDIERGQPQLALVRVRQVMALYGEAPHRLSTLAEVLTLTGDYAEASDMATRLLRGSQLDRSRAYNKLGNLAVVQGRFTAAYGYYSQAATEARAIGADPEVLVALYGQRSLGALVAGKDDVARDLAALEEYLRAVGRTAQAATIKFERGLGDAPKGRCPDMAAVLANIPESETRRMAERHMLRAASMRGCGKCTDALRAGLSAEERDTQSLFDFGLCAEREGSLTLAMSVYEQIDKGRITSHFHRILGLYHRAQILEKMNRPSEARAAYQQFLSHWLHADRSLPEIDAANHALERLH